MLYGLYGAPVSSMFHSSSFYPHVVINFIPQSNISHSLHLHWSISNINCHKNESYRAASAFYSKMSTHPSINCQPPYLPLTCTDSLSHQPPGTKQMYVSITCSFYYPWESLFVLEIITALGYYLALSLYHTIHNPKSQYFEIKPVFLASAFPEIICALGVISFWLGCWGCFNRLWTDARFSDTDLV